MRTIIYLCRHGEVHNPDQVVYGRLPGFSLSETGKQEAHRLGKHLSTKKLAAIYASPLTRTRETAGIVASYQKAGRDIVFDERLLEVRTPGLDGKPMAEVYDTEWNFYQSKYVKNGGESIRDLWKRMNHFLREAVKKHPGQEIAVFSHGDPIMVTRAKLRGKRLSFAAIREKPYVPTAKGVAIEFDGGSVISVVDLLP